MSPRDMAGEVPEEEALSSFPRIAGLSDDAPRREMRRAQHAHKEARRQKRKRRYDELGAVAEVAGLQAEPPA